MPKVRLSVEIDASNVPDPMTGHELVTDSLKDVLRLLRRGQTHGEGGNVLLGVSYEFEATPMFDHGDYMDGAGNMVHVGYDGQVISVTSPDQEEPTTFGGEVESPDAMDWAIEHGGLIPAGHDHEHEHDHEDGEDAGEDTAFFHLRGVALRSQISVLTEVVRDLEAKGEAATAEDLKDRIDKLQAEHDQLPLPPF